jgi:osmotically-inducible protein OsmY
MTSPRQAIDRVRGAATRTGRVAGRAAGRVLSDGAGLVERVRESSREPKDLDDATLKHKVETELFRAEDAPKGSVDVNAGNGIVTLRGQVKDPGMKARLERQALAIPEVRRVENLIHLPKTPAPTRADSPGRSRRRGSVSERERAN